MSLRGDWACTLCRTDRDPADAYERENVHSCRGARAPYTLSRQEQRVSSSSDSWTLFGFLSCSNPPALATLYRFRAFLVQRCENLALQLYSHALSAPFHEPVSPLVSPLKHTNRSE